ncbi:hypothetical protein [Streptomyces xanthochromogenes]|uniref:hypothetical protein n=1 Tax=Streptomyces xanthochromogenes TaxID=67384 RepID=UPI0034383829
MFNRIRRAASQFSGRLSGRRHRQRRLPSTAICDRANQPADGDRMMSPIPSHPQKYTEVLMGEETALVRPYLLASEQRTRQRATPPAVCALAGTPYCSAEDL